MYFFICLEIRYSEVSTPLSENLNYISNILVKFAIFRMLNMKFMVF
jgi:hypothetical protein